MYTIIELQSTNGTTAVVPPVSFNNLNEAYQKFYMALAAAAVSTIPTHAVVKIIKQNFMKEMKKANLLDQNILSITQKQKNNF